MFFVCFGATRPGTMSVTWLWFMVELLSYLAEEVDAILSNVAVITIQE